MRVSLCVGIAFNDGGGHGRLVRVKGHARSHPTCTRTPVNARPWNGAVISDPGTRRIGVCAAKEEGDGEWRTMRRGCIVHLERRDAGGQGGGE